ncbi:hypothetical protein DOY81_001011 [Sarcophaga bullata]|nr:hypothetical protein DOY81_001011 [Sarcophaga bullata]
MQNNSLAPETFYDQNNMTTNLNKILQRNCLKIKKNSYALNKTKELAKECVTYN